ncbi:MAG: hypothetical protein QOF06_758 [Solirubrobacterales bacterium]|jgi:hypothetical protein|nr:hypothetical protein [Solirubrobacterales bacterium]
MVAGVPGHGGATWAALQYALGFAELGHDVLVLDEVHGPGDRERRARALEEVAAAYELEGRIALIEGPGRSIGMPYGDVLAFAGSADLFVNLAGTVRDGDVLDLVSHRLFVDLDPGFTQLWQAEGIDLGLSRHTSFASVGLLLGDDECPIPDGGIEWRPTLPPVVLGHWPRAHEAPREGVTAIANWRSYGSLEHEGIRYGQKAHSARELFELPRLAGEPVRFALLIDPAEEDDLRNLRRHGWELLDPVASTGTPAAYAGFVRASAAELGIAKEGYVVSRCGWFSDRSVCYLASGRPVVAQRTGWERVLPEGEGLLGFAGSEDAAAALAEIKAEPERHAEAARDIAVEHFDSRRVLSDLIERGAG